VEEAMRVINGLSAGGGTQMVNAIDAALGTNVEKGRNRYIFFMTDGFVGNDKEIIQRSKAFVQVLRERRQRARVFGFGTGSSVNRYLIDGLSRAGDGVAVYVSSREDPEEAVNRFYHYIDRAVLTNLRVSWADLHVEELEPPEMPDLFASHAVILHGRYRGTPSATMTLRADAGEETVEIPIRVEKAVTGANPSSVLGTLWARSKVQHLEEALLGRDAPDPREAIVKLGLEFNLVTPYTSLIAIDTSRKVSDGRPDLVVQPNERPEGVDLAMAGYADEAAVGVQQEAFYDESLQSAGPMREQVYAVSRVEPKRGCGCRVAERRRDSGAWGAVIVALAALSRRKRDRQGRVML
jgi:Ca-activated chloride channel family protein